MNVCRGYSGSRGEQQHSEKSVISAVDNTKHSYLLKTKLYASDGGTIVGELIVTDGTPFTVVFDLQSSFVAVWTSNQSQLYR